MSQASQQMGSQTTGTTDQVKEKVAEASGQAQEKTKEAMQTAKSQMRSQVDERSTQAGETLSSAAGDARSIGEQLRQQQRQGAAKLADQAAERAERAGSYLKESDADRILSDAEDFARRQPWAVVAGGIVLGLAASRVLRASSRGRYQTTRIGMASPGQSSMREGNGLTQNPVGSLGSGTGAGAL